MSDFCGRINRIQPPEASAAKLCDELHQMGFCRGRDAAAEIACEADALVGELVEALDNLYSLCNNVPIRDEGLHQGPIFFGGSPFTDKRIDGDDERFEALEQAESALAKARGDQ